MISDGTISTCGTKQGATLYNMKTNWIYKLNKKTLERKWSIVEQYASNQAAKNIV